MGSDTKKLLAGLDALNALHDLHSQRATATKERLADLVSAWFNTAECRLTDGEIDREVARFQASETTDNGIEPRWSDREVHTAFVEQNDHQFPVTG